MSKLLKKIGLLIIIVVSICVVYFALFFIIVPPQYTTVYTASMLDKEERLLSIEEPKIILIGDSNVAFGIQSDLIEETIGMPVVNMGLHGGLGNKLLERFALPGIGEGDIVIICHSDYAEDEKIPQPDLAWITIENHVELWKTIDLQEWAQLIWALPDYSFNSISLWLSGRGNQCIDKYYTRNALNEYGDYSIFRENMKINIDDEFVSISINSKCIERLNWMNDFCTEKGATMMVAGHPILECEYTPSIEKYAEFQEELDERLTCDIISDYKDYRFQENYFFDTTQHLTTEGARIRTEQLIKDIQCYMENQNETGN